MKSILIKHVLLDGRKTNILIQGNRFANLSAPSDTEADKVIEAEGKAVLPPFYNTHTHAAMVLLRGYAEDMNLQTWLEKYIWPREDSLTAEDIKLGSRLACLEMIKSGTVFFSDMYFDIEGTIDVVDKMGMRASIGVTFMDSHSKGMRDAKKSLIREWKDIDGGRITLSAAPHAIYTVSGDNFRSAANCAREKGMKIITHLCETATEVENCIKAHGCTPVEYLDKLGILSDDVIAAHCVHLTENDIRILSERGVYVSHCPASNMKLSSGRFNYEKSGLLKMTLGTDGASSNNNLDMREEMKLATFYAKSNGSPENLPAEEVFRWATRNGAQAFGIDAGVIAEGKLADCILINLDDPKMIPLFNLTANWVYSADSSVIDTVICNGRVIMENRHVDGEEEIIQAVKSRWKI